MRGYSAQASDLWAIYLSQKLQNQINKVTRRNIVPMFAKGHSWRSNRISENALVGYYKL